MKEKELKSIIEREKNENDAVQYYSKHIELLIDIVNYGSNLIERALMSSKKRIEDVIVIAVLLKQIVQMMDGIQVLVKAGAGHVANLQARAAFEAYLYMLWILKEDSEKRARFYVVADTRKARLWALRLTRQTQEHKEFLKTFEKIMEHVEPSEMEQMSKLAQDELPKIEAWLQKPEWKEISEILGKKKYKNGNEWEWYKVLGVTSIRKLADELGELATYDLFYSRTSDIMHSASYRDQIQIRNGAMHLKPIRQLDDTKDVLYFSIYIAILSYGTILEHFRDEDIPQFVRKYNTEWRPLFHNIPAVSYRRVNSS